MNRCRGTKTLMKKSAGQGRDTLVSAFFFFLLLMCSLVPISAFAGSCSYTSQTPSFIQGNPPLTGSITVGRDVPIGTEIYRATYWATQNWSIACQAGTYLLRKDLKTTPFPLTSFSNFRGGSVYATSIPGIGVQIWSNGPTLPAADVVTYAVPTYPNWSSGKPSVNGNLSYDVSIIKIADVVGAGMLRGSDLPTFEFSFVGDTKLITLKGQVTGALSVVSRTCTTPDITVDLGTHNTNELNGVGTTTHWVSVPIQLNNCPAFFGYNTGLLTVDKLSTGSLGKNSISYSVSPITAVIVPNQGVMALQPDGVNPMAMGAGIQIANASGVPITYNSSKDSGLALNRTEGANYTIPLQARYYQTAANVTAGQANGAATVTLIYN